MTPIPRRVDDPGPVHTYFSLSYANYLVLRRTLMQSMPLDWQRRFTALLEEYDAAWSHLDPPQSFDVICGEQAQVGELDDEQMRACGITRADLDDDDKEVFWADRDGRQLTEYDYVTVPRADTIPFYNRGRTYLPPNITALIRVRADASATNL